MKEGGLSRPTAANRNEICAADINTTIYPKPPSNGELSPSDSPWVYDQFRALAELQKMRDRLSPPPKGSPDYMAYVAHRYPEIRRDSI